MFSTYHTVKYNEKCSACSSDAQWSGKRVLPKHKPQHYTCWFKWYLIGPNSRYFQAKWCRAKLVSLSLPTRRQFFPLHLPPLHLNLQAPRGLQGCQVQRDLKRFRNVETLSSGWKLQARLRERNLVARFPSWPWWVPLEHGSPGALKMWMLQRSSSEGAEAVSIHDICCNLWLN